MNKKGLSTIVITLIIILLSLVAIGVLWAVISRILSNSKDIEINQFTISMDITNAYENAGNISVDVKRNVGKGSLKKIKFVLSDGVNSEIITQDANLEELASKRFSLDPAQLAPTQIKTVSIAPVYDTEGIEKTGGILDTYTLGASSSGIEGCIPNCAGLQCGPDPLCGVNCGTCSGTDACTNNICVPLNCQSESKEQTCGENICGLKVNNCGIIVACGELEGNCPGGQTCSEGSCIAVTPLNSGIIEETWPGTSGMYFGSSDLPTNESYEGNYARFPGSNETDCLLIAVYRLPVEGYEKSHIGFSFESSISVEENYVILSSLQECQAYT